MKKLHSIFHILYSKFSNRHSIFHIPHSIFKWFTATRRRKFLLALSVLLVISVSLRFYLTRDVEAAWWPGDGSGSWLKRQKLTIVNSNASESLATGTTIAITVNTKSLVSQKKLQDDCDDLRILYQDGSTTTVLDRYISYPGGASCATSEASKVYFKINSNALDAAETDTNYYMYYGNSHASAPSNPDNAFDLGSKEALLVCPFDGTTTCAAGETPSTSPTANRYPGSKSALSFDNVNDEVDVGTDSSIDDLPNNDFTIESWVYPGTITGSWQYFFGAKTGSSSSYQIFWSGLSHLPTVWVFGSSQGLSQSSIALTAYQWQHFAVTWDSTTKISKIYINGQEVSYSTQTAMTGTYLGDASSNKAIGSGQWSEKDLKGLFDEFRISNVIRYTSNFTPQTSPFVRDDYTKLLYHFDENGDDPRQTGKANDDSGNANHGTITGAKYVAGLVGIDSSTTDTGKADGGNTYAGHEGILLEEGTTNKITNPSFEHSTYNTNWTAGANITATENTTAPYFKFGSKSAKLVASADGTYTIPAIPGDTNMHTLSTYVYDGTSGNIGGTVNSNIAQLLYEDEVVTPTSYQDMGGGWWRMEYYNFTGNTESYPETNFDTLQGLYTTTSNKYLSQGVQISGKTNISTILLYLRRTGSGVSYHGIIQIQTDTGGVPSGTVVTNGTSECTDLYGSYFPQDVNRFQEFIFTGQPLLEADTQYHLVLIPYTDHCTTPQSSPNGTNYINWGYDNSSSSYTTGDRATYDGFNWTTVSGTDHIFKLLSPSYTGYDGSNAPSSYGLYQSTSNKYLAQGFQVDYNASVADARLYMSRYGTGTLTTSYFQVEIQTDNTGLPSGTVVTNGTSECRATPSNLTSSDSVYVNFKFPTYPSLATGTQYHLVLKPYLNETCATLQSSVNNSNYMIWRYDGSTPTYSHGNLAYYSTSWTAQTGQDFGFLIDFSTGIHNYGVQVKNGKTVYIDGVQFEEKYFATSFVDGSLDSNYYWSPDCFNFKGGNQGTSNNSCSIRPAASDSMTQSRVNKLQYDASSFNKDAFTISFWIKPQLDYRKSDADYGWGRNHPLMTLYGDFSNNFMLEVHNDSDHNDTVYLTANHATTAGSAPTYGNYAISSDWTGQWKHIVWTFDITGSYSVYLNNSSIISNSNSGKSTLASLVNLQVGSGGNVSYGTADAIISDVRVFNDDLTSTEVADLYYSGLVSHSDNYEVDAFSDDKGQNPVGLWHFDEAYGTTAHDSSRYGNDLTVSGASWHSTSPAPNALSLRHLHYDATDDYAYQNFDREFDFGTDGFTLQGWFQHPSTISGTDTILARYGSAGWKVYMNSSGYLCFGVDDDSSWDPDYSACSTTSYADSSWHHFDAVKDTSTITLYIDGNQVAQTGSVFQGSLSANAKLYIGIDSDGTSNPWDADIDEVAIYPYAKTATQIKTDLSSSPIASSFGMSLTGLEQGLVGYWKMDESSGNNVSDSSGNENTGTADDINHTNGDSDTPPPVSSGKFGNGRNLDGTDDNIDLNNTSLLQNLPNGTFSASTWFYLDSNAGQNDYIRPILAKSNHNGFSWHMGIRNADGAIQLIATIENVANSYANTTSTPVSTGTWYLATMTYNNNSDKKIHLYLNGNEATYSTQTAYSGTYTSDATRNLKVGSYSNNGSWGDGDGFWDGKIDEVRIYNRALSPTEVSQLYNWAPGPVAYWKLDENTGSYAYDSSGNGNTGTLTNGPTWTTGKFGSAVNFADTDNYIDAGNPDTLKNLHSNAFTVMGWINSKTANRMIMFKAGGNGYEAGWGVQHTATDGLQMWVNCGTNAAYSRSGTDDFSTDTLYHFAITYDNNAATRVPKIYLNGSEVPDYSGQNACDQTIDDDASYPFTFGGTSYNSDLNGMMDDVKIYNYARTPSQIISDMNAGHPAPGSPVGSAVAKWHFDEGYGTTAQDSSQNDNDLTLSTTAWTNSGKFGKAWDGDGSNWLTRSDDSDFDVAATDDYTISAWFKSDAAANPSIKEYILAKPTDFATQGGYGVAINTSGYPTFEIDDDGVWNPDDAATATTDYYDANWHHIAAVKTGTTKIELFVDGQSIATDSTIDAVNTLANSQSLVVGDFNASNNGDEFNGDIDEVNIFRSALTADQIKQLHIGGVSSLFGATSTDSSGNATWSDTNAYCPPGQGTTCVGPVAEWKFDEKTGTKVYDSSGNNHTATMDSNSGWARGKFGSAGKSINNNPTSQVVTDSTNNLITTSLTISAWVYTNDSSSGFYVFNKNYGSGNGAMALTIQDTLSFRLINTTGTEARVEGVGLTINPNQWNHVAGTWDGTTIKAYINGILQSTTNTLTGSVNSTNYFVINSSHWGATKDVLVDNVKVYDYARTPAQVAWEYNRGGPQSWWKFDECSGTNLNDSGPTNNHGTLTIGASLTNTSTGTCSSGTGTEAWNNGTSGKRNASIDFDGTDDWASFADRDEYSLSTNGQLSVSFWYKPATVADALYLVNKRAAANYEWDVRTGASGAIRAFILQSDNTVYMEATSATGLLTAGNWYHVLFTADSASPYLKLYLNGVLVAQDSSSSGTIANGTANIVVAKDGAGATYVDGLIDDVKVWDYALTQQQVKDNYNQGTVHFGP